MMALAFTLHYITLHYITLHYITLHYKFLAPFSHPVFFLYSGNRLMTQNTEGEDKRESLRKVGISFMCLSEFQL